MQYSIQIWSSENGLPQNSINDIVQTVDGYIWFSTFDGLVRFDGVNFKIFNTSNTLEFTSNYIGELYADKKNRLWVTMQNRILKYENGEFIPLEIYLDFHFQSVFFAENNIGDIILGFDNHGLYKYAHDSITLEYKINKISFRDIKFINNKLYIIAKTSLFVYENSTLDSIPLNLKPEKFINNFFDRNNLQFFTKDSIYKSEKGKIKPSEYNQYLPKQCQIQDVLIVNKKQVIISTNKGLIVVRDNNPILYDEKNGLSSNKIISILCDFDQNIWAGTFADGVNFLKEKAFQTFNENTYSTMPIIQDQDSSIWVGYNCGGISIIDKRGIVLKEINVGENNCVRSLLTDGKGNVWVGTDGRGIYIFDEKGIEKKQLDFNEDIIRVIFQDSKNKIWIGAYSGVYQFDKKSGQKVLVDNYVDVGAIIEDTKGNIWCGSFNGIKIYNQNKSPKKELLKGSNARAIYEDKKGFVWIGTYGGGLKLFKNDELYSYDVKNGEINQNISCIIEDENGYLWMTSNNGIYKIERKSLENFSKDKSTLIKSRVYAKNDGIKNIEFNGGFQPSVWKDYDGNFWFPSLSGVVKLTSQNLPLKAKTKILIEEVLLDGKQLSSNIIPGKSDELIINYTIPSFLNAQNIRFQYKMDGLNAKWVDAGIRRSAYYSNIPGGNYTFRVRSDINPEIEARFSFSVPIPYWKTWWFILGIILFVILVFILILMINTKAIKARALIKTKENKRFAEMELAALRAQMNPHFIFNCLNTIKYFVSTKDDKSANKYLNKFSKLMRMFLEHSKSNTITLQEEIDLLTIYIELENLRFNDNFDFKLVIHDDLNTNDIKIPSMLFQPFVENAINHGLLNLSRKGALTIELYIKNNTLVGIVDDDGIGREKAREMKNKRSVSHISRGLEITNERIQVINAVKNMNIYIETIDKFDNNMASGTKVILYIPIKN